MRENAFKSIGKPFIKTTNALSKNWTIAFRYKNSLGESKIYRRAFDLNQSPYVEKGIVNEKASVQKHRLNRANDYVRDITSLLEMTEFDVDRGDFVEDKTKLPIVGYFDDWKLWKKNKVKASTLTTYDVLINVFKGYLKTNGIETISLERTNYKLLNNFLNHIQDTTSKNTYNYYLTFLKNFYKYLIDIEKINIDNPTTQFIKHKKEDTEKHAKYDNPLQAIQDLTQYDYPLGLMAKTIYYTLHRLETITSLQYRDFDIPKGLINIPASKTKNNKKVTVRIHRNLLADLKDYLKTNTPQPMDYFLGYDGEVIGKKNTVKFNIKMFGKEKTNRNVFGKRFNTFKKKKSTNKTLFTANHTLYGFKHSGVVNYKSHGLTDHQIIKITGHHSVDILATYSKQYEAVLPKDVFDTIP